MRNTLKTLSLTITVALFLSGCYDRDIIDEKDFHHTLPTVENLSYTQVGNNVTLTWQIPDDISEDFIRPVEVSIQVVEDNIYRQKVAVLSEGTTVNIPITSGKQYRFVVKLLGFLTPEAREEGRTDRVFSEGRVIEIE